MRDNFLHFAQPGVFPNFLIMSCVIFMFRGTGRSSSVTNCGSSRLNIGRETSGNTSLKTPEAAHGEPMMASKSSNVVTSGIIFTALNLITRPSPFRATMCLFCVETFSQPRAQVPLLRHDISCDFSSNSEHHCCPEWQEHSSMLTFLQSLMCRFPHSPHDIYSGCPLHVQQSTETPESEQRWDSQLDSKGQKEALLSSPQLI